MTEADPDIHLMARAYTLDAMGLPDGDLGERQERLIRNSLVYQGYLFRHHISALLDALLAPFPR